MGFRYLHFVTEVRVPNVLDLAEGTSVNFEFELQEGPRAHKREAFVLRWRGEFLAFVNECPHWALELDLGDGHFYDPELDRIYCKNHGALFVLPTGQCETGPCLGRALIRLELRLVGRDALVIT